MKFNIQFFAVEDIIEINKALIGGFGGLFGVRDSRLLDSAVANCQASFGGEYMFRTVPEMAACYAQGIIKNYPFC